VSHPFRASNITSHVHLLSTSAPSAMMEPVVEEGPVKRKCPFVEGPMVKERPMMEPVSPPPRHVRHRTRSLARVPHVGGGPQRRRRNGIGSQQRRRQNGGRRYGDGCNLGHLILLLFASGQPRLLLQGRAPA